MREILFRGKTQQHTRWIYGDLNHYMCDDGMFIAENGHSMHRVFKDTIGQFTGLTDKNGKKIFEGDLLNGFDYPFYRSKDNKHNYFAEVVWFDNGAFGLVTHKYPDSRVRGISAGNADYFDEEFDCDNWEVIGNIYDNPELLEVTDNA